MLVPRLFTFRRLPTIGACCLLLLGSGFCTPRGLHPERATLFDAIQSRESSQAYTPAEIATAYGFTPLYERKIAGAGQTVALIEMDAFNSIDIAAFDQTYGLPLPNIQSYYVGGHPFTLDTQDETSFDVEWLHALAPEADIQIYYLDPIKSPWRQMASAFRMAWQNGASTISVSLGACPGRGHSAVTRHVLSDLLKRGVSVFASSGDYGDHAGPREQCGSGIGVAYPASDPSVVAVGGTSLYLKGDDTIDTEIAWRLSGGGRAQSLRRKTWQRAPSMPVGPARWAPDVAFIGDAHTGVAYMHDNRWLQAGGTSLGAPAWAAAWALIRQDMGDRAHQLPGAPRLIYRIGNSAQYQGSFHDVTSGTNGAYQAGVGWDAVTGWGTPDVNAIDADVKAMTGS